MCDWPDCKEKGKFSMEACNENDETEILDVLLCRKHYIETLFYNGLNPEDEGIELTDDEKKTWQIEQNVYQGLV